jgi:hypothetical protein
MSNWNTFWSGLAPEEKILFRVIQRAHRELGKNRQMFCHSWMGAKQDLKDYITERFGVDLENLPKDEEVQP